MKRREFVKVVGGAMASWPLATKAQQQTVPVIGYADGSDLSFADVYLADIRKGLAANGLVEGKDFRFELRSAHFKYDRLPDLFRELVEQKVAVILAGTTLQLEAAKGVTRSIPIIFLIGVDPVENGFVASMNRPGGNITGIFNFSVGTTGKRVEALRELIPSLTKFAFLDSPKAARLSEIDRTAAQEAAKLLRLDFLIVNAFDVGELEMAFETSVREGAGGMVVGSNGAFNSLAKPMAALAVHHRLPVIHAWDGAVREGVLISYGLDQEECRRLQSHYIARILSGEKPADLPVQLATKSKMVINLKTAKALGLTVSSSLLARADEVID